MAENQLLPFALASGANVLSAEQYAGLLDRQNGYSPGLARSVYLNTTWRQAAFAASMIGQFTADYAEADVLDDGDLATFEANFVKALRLSLGAAVQHYVVDQSQVPNQIAVTVPVETYAPGLPLLVKVANASTGPVTLSMNGLPAKAVLDQARDPLTLGALEQGGIYLIVCDADLSFQVLGGSAVTQTGGADQNSLWHYGVDTGPANALAAACVPAVTALTPGLTVLIKPRRTNTGPATLTLDGLDTRAIVRFGSTPLSAGDIVINAGALLYFDGTAWQLLNPIATFVGDGSGGGGGGTLPENWNTIAGGLTGYFHVVVSTSVSTPPANPTLGDCYLIPAGGTDAWAGLGGQVAQSGPNGTWVYRDYPVGFVLGVADGTGAGVLLRRGVDGWRSAFATKAEALTATDASLVLNPPQALALVNDRAGPDALLFFGCL